MRVESTFSTMRADVSAYLSYLLAFFYPGSDFTYRESLINRLPSTKKGEKFIPSPRNRADF